MDARPLIIEGMTPEQHRATFPNRWRKTVRAWPEFWWSLGVIPAICIVNWINGSAWDASDSALATGWIAARFFTAMKGDNEGKKVNWYLDRPTIWQRIKRTILTENAG